MNDSYSDQLEHVNSIYMGMGTNQVSNSHYVYTTFENFKTTLKNACLKTQIFSYWKAQSS